MIVSWNWLKDYVTLDIAPDEVVRRLAMAGLNHEGTEPCDGDLAIDIEVTSNRADCLGHLGIAREIAVLLDQPLRIPEAAVKASGEAVETIAKVAVQCPTLCPRYTARVIRGVKVGPSPDWLVKRLQTIGIKSINNIVDVTNYVLMECGQPLHAFDLALLRGRQIVVREPHAGEQLTAIDHKAYPLEPGMCVIADAERAVAIGGIMGGLESEVSDRTTDVLIESAEFQPLAIRNAARRLKLHSPSSYRFERGLDPQGVDWASRRCCELIVQLAGGELAAGVIDVSQPRAARPSITLRHDQLPRILGIDVPAERLRTILTALGGRQLKSDAHTTVIEPPSWRRDLSREIDLIEEVARIHGYEQIPEDVAVPMTPSHRSDADRLLAKVRGVLTAVGFDEAITISAVSQAWADAFSPWSDAPPLRCSVPVIKGADLLRRSLVPSLLAVRATNESLGAEDIELFESAKVYLPRENQLPDERLVAALTSGGDFLHVKGIVECLLDNLQCRVPLEAEPYSTALFAPGRAARLLLDSQLLGFVGETSAEAQKQFSLRGATTVAELSLSVLQQHAQLVPQYQPLVSYPAMTQDLNIIVDESLAWAELSRLVRASAGPLLEAVAYRETYRDPKSDGPGKKRLLFSIRLRSTEGTLTSEQAGQVRSQIVQAIAQQLGGRLLG